MRYSWIALLLFVSPLSAQVVIPEGDTLNIRVMTGTDTVRVVETDTIRIVETDTLVVTDTLTVVETDTLVVTDTLIVVEVDTVYVEVPGEGCPVDWTCIPPASLYEFSLDALRGGRSGATSVVEGTYFRHLYRLDGVWDDLAEIAAPGVDSVVFVWDGSRNRERLYPYDVGGSGSAPFSLLFGTYVVCWEVFGTEPDSACKTVTITTQFGFRFPNPVPMKPGTMRQAVFPLNDIRPIGDYFATLDGVPGTPLPDDMGWYWLPAGDGEIITGSN